MSQVHESLVAWQRADPLCVLVYATTRDRFPREERYALTSQLRRAAYSVAANVAEGFAFQSPRIRLRHLHIAIGSLTEVGYGVHLATRLGYLTAKQAAEWQTMIRKTAAPLHGLAAHEKREATTRGREVG
jgi:four helix bundle protein